VERVGRNDSFFDLGGHSLLMIRLQSELQSKGLDIDVRTVFAQPILKDMAVECSGSEVNRSHRPCCHW